MMMMMIMMMMMMMILTFVGENMLLWIFMPLSEIVLGWVHVECYQDLIMCSNKFSFALLTRNRGSSLAPFGIVESKNLGL